VKTLDEALTQTLPERPRPVSALATPHRHRVLFLITSSGVGGAERVLENVISRIDRTRFEPILCSLREPGAMAHGVAASGVRVESLGLRDAARAADIVRGARRLARLLDRERIDLVHSFLYRANVLARLAARFSSRHPIVLTGHHSLTPPPSGRIGVWAERLTHRLSDRCVAVSGAVRRRLLGEHAPERIVDVIDNGVDCEYFASARSSDALRRELGLCERGLVVGGAGRLTPVKGFDLLIDAVAAVRNAGVDAVLLLAGNGPSEAALRARARERSIAEHVFLLGVQSDLRRFYAALDVFVLSSLEEASPTVVLEAMAAGRPVVATRCGGSLEMVEDGVSGLLVQAGRTDALTGAILRVASDPTLRSELAAGGWKRVNTHFGVERMVERHCDLYRRMLEHDGTGS
jgi:L-malate glycosyltransferase